MAFDIEPFAAIYARFRNEAAIAAPVDVAAEPPPPNEQYLQALWQDNTRRPRVLALPDGTPVEVLNPGRWNHSFGPDFQDALLSVGGILRRGDIELHLTPADWDAHGHATDAAYRDLILHVTWLPDPPAKTLPDGLPSLALQPFMEEDEPFDINELTLAPSPGPHPCTARFTGDPAALDRLLLSAGHFRLLAKSKVLSRALTNTADPIQPLYAGLLAAMGFGRNGAPFRRLAEEVPLSHIEELGPLDRFAALAGVAGLLKPEQEDLWKRWFLTGLQPPLEPFAWDLRAMRPSNHPYRRLAGAIGILHALPTLLTAPLKKLPKALVDASTLLAEPLHLSTAPIGKNRANAIVINLFVPYRLATRSLDPTALDALPSEDISAPMREVWHRLSGDTEKPLPKDGLRQQGLLQIYNDFCNSPNTVCANCPLA